MRVYGVSNPNWTFEDGRYRLEVRPTVKVGFDANRGRAAWRTLPALIPSPWTAHSHIVIKLPGAGSGVTLAGGEDRVLTLPAVDWRRKTTLAGDTMIEDLLWWTRALQAGRRTS